MEIQLKDFANTLVESLRPFGDEKQALAHVANYGRHWKKHGKEAWALYQALIALGRKMGYDVQTETPRERLQKMWWSIVSAQEAEALAVGDEAAFMGEYDETGRLAFYKVVDTTQGGLFVLNKGRENGYVAEYRENLVKKVPGAEYGLLDTMYDE